MARGSVRKAAIHPDKQRNKKQETRNKKQETRNKKQETRNKKQETENSKQGYDRLLPKHPMPRLSQLEIGRPSGAG